MITVLMATRNRASILKRVLTSYLDLTPPPGGWKLVIVDNGSSDDTDEVVREFASRLPVCFLKEMRPGKTNALNAGLTQVEGDLTLLTDDDILPPKEWLCVYRAAADRLADFHIFGGAYIPKWPFEPPAWATSDRRIISISFGHWDPDRQDGPIDYHDVVGGNFAVRTALFQRYQFDPDIGPRGRNYAMGSETEFLARLTADGYKCWYLGEAAAEHIIREDQLDRAWMFERAVKSGRGAMRLEVSNLRSKTWFGVPRFLWRRFLVQVVRTLIAYLKRDEICRFQEMWELNSLKGRILESRALQKSLRSSKKYLKNSI